LTFDVTILGCGAATPTSKHNPSAQVVNVHDKLFLVDCGEGTQMQMRKFKVRFQRINHVFISHLHGDHYLGLMGFISSMHLLGRQSPLHVYGPADLKDIIDLSLRVSQTFLEYPLVFHATSNDDKQLLFEDKTLLIYSVPLKHRIYCCGFQFVEKDRLPKVSKAAIAQYNLIPSQILDLKKGKDLQLETGILKNAEVCSPPPAARSYAYCSDTAYYERLIPMLQGTTLIYHESTFLEEEKERAKATFHSTAKQAAKIAKACNASLLMLGHFSSRYTNDEDFKQQALEEFPNVILADEGLLVTLPKG
jgi:ribonuclease Z